MALKGKTTFELTNVETGEVAVTEDNNMLTNALKYLLTSYPFDTDTTSVIRKLCLNRTDSYDTASSGLKRVMNMLTGGIILFDSALEEDADNIFPPAGVESVACGAPIAYSGINTHAGSYNGAESGPVTDEEGNTIGYKHVWDFATSQGNGHIASACLTTREGGHIGAGVTYALKDDEYTVHKYGDRERLIDLEDLIGVREVINSKDRDGTIPHIIPFVYADYNKNYIATVQSQYAFYTGYLNPNNTSYNANTIISKRNLTLELRAIPFTEMSIFSYYDTIGFNPYTTVTVEMPNTLKDKLDTWKSERASSAYIRYGCSCDEGFVYIWIYGGENSTSATPSSAIPENDIIHVWKINTEDFTSTHLQIPNTTGHKLLCTNASQHVGQQIYITNNYMLVTSWESSEVDGVVNYYASPYMIELSDPTNVIEVLNADGSKPRSSSTTNSTAYSSHAYSNAYTIRNKVYYTQGLSCFVIDLVSGKRYYRHTLRRAEIVNNDTYGHAHALYVQNSPGLIVNLASYSGNSSTVYSCAIRRHPELLLTINNLDTPVTKTTAQTMKVTYTLLEENDEEE